VLVAVGDQHVRAALRLLLARDPAFRVVGDSQDVTELLRDAAAAEPELVLLDGDLPGLLTGGAVAELRRLCPAAFIALSTRDEQRPRALAAGVAAFVGKSEPPARLLTVLRAAAPGQSPRATTPPVVRPASL